MFEILAVTRSAFFPGREAFLRRLDAIASAGVNGVVLREKDLPQAEYIALAREVQDICESRSVKFIPHSFIEAARSLECRELRLPWELFQRISRESPELSREFSLGVSIHSFEEACYARKNGAASLTAGHIFRTGCKEGQEGRGLEFLAAVCQGSLPVYGIGGITGDNIRLVMETGAAGACLMSSLMECPEPAALITGLRERLL